MVDCTKVGVVVPKTYIKQGKIVLNIDNNATSGSIINDESISFKARFDGESQAVKVPIGAVFSIYTGENGKGMFFKNNTQDAEQNNQKKPNLTLLD